MNRHRPRMDPERTPMPSQPVAQRLTNNDEVLLGYTAHQAMIEAERCLRCPDRYCAVDCPAGNPIPEFLTMVSEGRFAAAHQALAANNPMFGITSRVCPAECQCELRCTRGINDQPVNIAGVERFVFDHHQERPGPAGHEPAKAAAPGGHTAAVVGGGPAGIAAALALQEAGVQVTIWEREQTLGGVMSWGIPQFVLPPAVLAELLDRVGRSGIQVRTGVEVGAEITLAELHRSHDLVFLGTGAPVPVALRVPGAETAGVVQAGDYLSAGSGARPAAREVIVLGGGNTAIDACRVALRSGAERVRLVYRRNRAAMPATATEIEFALTEGTELVELASPAAIMLSRDRLAVQCQVMTPSAPNYPGGRPNVVPTGELRTLEADLVVLALGYLNGPLPGLEVDDRRRIQVDRDHGTSLPRTYAGGDAVTGPATVVAAMAAGRDAGRIMARSLGLEAARG